MIKGKNILLGVSGGIAAYKVLDLCSRLKKEGKLKIIMTKAACEFVSPFSFETMGKCLVYSDMSGKEVMRRFITLSFQNGQMFFWLHH